MSSHKELWFTQYERLYDDFLNIMERHPSEHESDKLGEQASEAAKDVLADMIEEAQNSGALHEGQHPGDVVRWRLKGETA